VEVLGSTCVGEWASRSHGSCCRHRGTKPSGSENPRAYLLAWATRSHSSCCSHKRTKPVGSRSPGTCLLAQATRRLAAVQAWGTQAWRQQEFWGLLARCHRSCYSHRRTKPEGSRSPGACLPVQASGSVIEQLLSGQETKPAGLHLLLPVEQEAWVLFLHGHQFPWHFTVKFTGRVVGGSVEP
jgi:hypothetical protein